MDSINGEEYEFIFIDFEYRQVDGVEGNPIEVICMVALNSSTNTYAKLWADELVRMDDHPFGNNDKTVLVAYYASAEMACFEALGWNWPKTSWTYLLSLKIWPMVMLCQRASHYWAQ